MTLGAPLSKHCFWCSEHFLSDAIKAVIFSPQEKINLWPQSYMRSPCLISHFLSWVLQWHQLLYLGTTLHTKLLSAVHYQRPQQMMPVAHMGLQGLSYSLHQFLLSSQYTSVSVSVTDSLKKSASATYSTTYFSIEKKLQQCKCHTQLSLPSRDLWKDQGDNAAFTEELIKALT